MSVHVPSACWGGGVECGSPCGPSVRPRCWGPTQDVAVYPTSSGSRGWPDGSEEKSFASQRPLHLPCTSIPFWGEDFTLLSCRGQADFLGLAVSSEKVAETKRVVSRQKR